MAQLNGELSFFINNYYICSNKKEKIEYENNNSSHGNRNIRRIQRTSKDYSFNRAKGESMGQNDERCGVRPSVVAYSLDVTSLK